MALYDIIGKRKYFYAFSWLWVALAVFAIAAFGLELGIDFTGGSLLEVEFSGARPESAAVERALAPLEIGGVQLQPAGERGLIMRFRDVDEETHQAILRALADAAPESRVAEKQFTAVGPVIGGELQQKAVIALAITMLAIIAYIAWAFRRVSEPVSSWKYGVVAVVSLAHDVVIPTGIFALLGHYGGVQIDALFVTALLTVMGFSVHDTIVVFDRVREKLRTLRAPESFEVTVNKSVNETITRSINTSLTVLIVLAALYILGGESLKHFALALIIGISFGTYSSIFFASPLLVTWHLWSQRRGVRRRA